MKDILPHVWRPHATNATYIELQGHKDALVRIKPMLNGKYLWQYRKQSSWSNTIEEAKNWVEALAEFYPRKAQLV